MLGHAGRGEIQGGGTAGGAVPICCAAAAASDRQDNFHVPALLPVRPGSHHRFWRPPCTYTGGQIGRWRQGHLSQSFCCARLGFSAAIYVSHCWGGMATAHMHAVMFACIKIRHVAEAMMPLLHAHPTIICRGTVRHQCLGCLL